MRKIPSLCHGTLCSHEHWGGQEGGRDFCARGPVHLALWWGLAGSPTAGIKLCSHYSIGSRYGCQEGPVAEACSEFCIFTHWVCCQFWALGCWVGAGLGSMVHGASAEWLCAHGLALSLAGPRGVCQPWSRFPVPLLAFYPHWTHICMVGSPFLSTWWTTVPLWVVGWLLRLSMGKSWGLMGMERWKQ